MTHRIARRVSIRYLVSMRLWKSMVTSRLDLGFDHWDHPLARGTFRAQDQFQNEPMDDNGTSDAPSTRYLQTDHVGEMLRYRTLSSEVHSDSAVQETGGWSTDRDESRQLVPDATSPAPDASRTPPCDNSWRIGPSALNRFFQHKTVCNRGHEYRPELLLPGFSGWRPPHGF